MDQFEAMSMPRITQKSPIVYTVETPRGEHPSLQLKRLSPAENHGPCRPTDSPCPLLYVALIRTIPPLAIYVSQEFSCLLSHFLTNGGEMNVEGDGVLHSF